MPRSLGAWEPRRLGAQEPIATSGGWTWSLNAYAYLTPKWFAARRTLTLKHVRFFDVQHGPYAQPYAAYAGRVSMTQRHEQM